MSDIDPIWWIVLGALVVALVGWLLFVRHRHMEQARREATALRDRAAEGEVGAAQAEDRARHAQEQARAAQAEAERLRREADDAVAAARDERDRVTEDHLLADEVDPDVRTVHPRHDGSA